MSATPNTTFAAGCSLGPSPELWLPAHATACAEAVASALELLDTDDVRIRLLEDGFALTVEADPPRHVQAVRWSAPAGWSVTADGEHHEQRRWTWLPLPADADPLALRDALCTDVSDPRPSPTTPDRAPVQAPRPHRRPQENIPVDLFACEVVR